MRIPLAARMRPNNIDEMVGQEHLIAKGKPLRKIIDNGIVPNMIFYGVSGVGKTTLAQIIADKTDKKLYKLNATTASTNDVKDIISELHTLTGINGIIIYIDEIQYFTKKQQQILLEFIENGSVTLIASTTENPYFYIYNAIISRSTIFEFKPISSDNIKKIIIRGFDFVSKESNIDIVYDAETVDYISQTCGGDIRKALNSVELLTITKPGQKSISISLNDAKDVSQCSNMRYDRDGDMHYDILSAFQKSIRGSDPDASIHYAARLIKSGDLISICRRLLVIACEDIGLAYPQAIAITKACVDSAMQLGLPEARIPISEAVIFLATLPKSNSALCAIDNALSDLDKHENGNIPAHLLDAHYTGAEKMGHGINYKYPHLFKNNYVPQQYMPDNFINSKYYLYGKNKIEQNVKNYWDVVKNEKEK